MPDESPGDGSAPDRRLAELDARVQGAEAKLGAERQAREALEARARQARASAAAWRIMFDVVAAVGVCGGLGMAADLLVKSTPWGLVLGLFFGLGLGMWLAARRAAAVQRESAGDAPAGEG